MKALILTVLFLIPQLSIASGSHPRPAPVPPPSATIEHDHDSRNLLVGAIVGLVVYCMFWSCRKDEPVKFDARSVTGADR